MPSDQTAPGPQVAAPPGGPLLAVAKRGAEHLLWARVALQRRAEDWRGYAGSRPLPRSVPVTGVLRTTAMWEAAVAEARHLRLPLHRDLPKNWDALGAVGAVLSLVGEGSGSGSGSGGDGAWRSARVMDAGSARYSPVLPWLRLYGLGEEPGSLLGINLEFGEPVTRDGVVFRHGDVTATGLADGSLDAVTCMSVIEHGVPLVPFLQESARVLRPGGILCVSTDFDQAPPDTSGHAAYGTPVHIFSPEEVIELIAAADGLGLELVGDLSTSDAFAHEERPVHWKRVGLDYTFILLTFRRRSCA